MVVIVVGNKVLYRIIGEEFPELAAKMGRQSLIMGKHQGWAVDIGNDDIGDFDLILHIAYDKKPLTRAERAKNVKKRDFISKYNEQAQKVLNILLDKYMNEGIYEMENEAIFNTPLMKKMLGGNITKVMGFFDGPEGFYSAIKELESALYAA